MDTLSHGLWGSILFGRKNKRYFWWSFAFGVLPDLLVFAPFFALSFLGFYEIPNIDYEMAHPGYYSMPSFVHGMYNITHSFIVFGAIFLFVWIIRKKPFTPLWAWFFHIALDIPTHSSKFFPTPFLWPVSNFSINGIPWSVWWIFLPNVLFLVFLYCYYFLFLPWKKKRRGVSFFGG